MHVECRISTDTDEGRYLVNCARIRDVTVTHLVKRLLDTITRDQLVSAVLDDGGVRRRVKFAKRFREIA